MNDWMIAAPAFLTTAAAAAGITAYGAVYPRSQLFGATVCRTNSPRKLALTFDDGPNPAITPKLLDLLDRFKARATFFVIGKHARECPDLLKETAARGHVIGNHTDAHPNLFWLKPDQITVELRCCNFSIVAATGAPPRWFRPPFGFRNPWVIPMARELKQRAEHILRLADGRPGHIFNLGHGILPHTPFDNVKNLAQFVREFSSAAATSARTQ